MYNTLYTILFQQYEVKFHPLWSYQLHTLANVQEGQVGKYGQRVYESFVNKSVAIDHQSITTRTELQYLNPPFHKIDHDWDSTRGSLVSEETALPTAPQPLT